MRSSRSRSFETGEGESPKRKKGMVWKSESSSDRREGP